MVVTGRGSAGGSSRQLVADLEPTAGLPFQPEGHIHWTSPSADVRFLGWHAGEPVEPAHEEPDGRFIAVSGTPVLVDGNNGPAVPGPQQLIGHVDDPQHVAERVEGMYAIVGMKGDGSGWAVNDPLGLHPLYHWSGSGVFAVGNQPGLVAAIAERVTGAPPAPNEEAVAWVAFCGQVFGDDSGTKGIHALEPGVALRITAAGAVDFRDMHLPPWMPPRDEGQGHQERIDAIERRMRSTIVAAVSSASTVSCELTAGHDSRMVLDLASRAGVASDLNFYTFGAPDSTDHRAAGAIAHDLGLRHGRRLWPMMPGGPKLENFVAHVRQVGGQLSCWELSWPVEREGITLSGLAGEALRTNYEASAGIETVEEALSAFEQYPFGRFHYLRPGVVERQRRLGRELFVVPLADGAPPEALFDAWYVRQRLRRWVGARPDRFFRHILPLYSPRGIRLALTSSWRFRAEARLHEEIRRRADLPIGHISFGKGQTWTSTARRASSGSARTARLPVAQRSLHLLPTPEETLRMRKDAFLDALDFDAQNRAFDLVDPDLMRADVARYEKLDRRQKIELHNALTAVLWLGLAAPGRRARGG